MGYEVKKSEHVGPKEAKGAFWGRKADARRESNRKRREDGKTVFRAHKE